ncbi:MAG TPA: hypothetical protein DCS04_02320 [Ruminococcaceae bacterium]|nr:hypothetical protein [Oscillospiraceae bacterium]
MKKFLAILLSVIMLFSFGIIAFAEGEETTGDLPNNIGKKEGKIVLSIENTYIEASKEYSIPVRLYADYLSKVPADAEKLYIGAAGIDLAGDMKTEYAELKEIRFADGVSLEKVEASYDPTTLGYMAFGIDKAHFNEYLSTSDEGIIIAYIDIVVNDNLPEEYGVDFGQLYFDGTYDLNYTLGEQYPEIGQSAGFILADGTFSVIETPGSPDDDIVYDTACFYHTPYVPTWKERLTTWAKAQGHLFVSFFITILEVLDSFLTK